MLDLPMIRNHAIGMTLCVVTSIVISAPLASSPAQTVTSLAKINTPAPDSQVSGTVQISGTAIDPSFLQYELDYAADPLVSADAWQPIQPPIAQQVQDGVLGAWNTTRVADGPYWIRLRVIRQDGTALEDRVRVRVANATATPTPTETIASPATPMFASPTPGPSPTSPIWQPPTRTPRPTLAQGGPTPTPKAFSVDNSPFRPERLQQAAWSGLLLALGAFALLGLYSLVRAAVRGELRRDWRQFRAEFIHPLLNALRRRKS